MRAFTSFRDVHFGDMIASSLPVRDEETGALLTSTFMVVASAVDTVSTIDLWEGGIEPDNPSWFTWHAGSFFKDQWYLIEPEDIEAFR